MKRSFGARIARRLEAALLLFFTAWFALILLIAHAGESSVAHTVEHDRHLASDFKKTARFVEAFHAQRGRLPKKDELAHWSERRMRSSEPFIIEAGEEQFAEEALAAFGLPPRGGFVLGIWRGEWMEYHASWSGSTTVPSDESAYYLFGSRAADQSLGGLGLLVCLAGGPRRWKRRSRGEGRP